MPKTRIDNAHTMEIIARVAEESGKKALEKFISNLQQRELDGRIINIKIEAFNRCLTLLNHFPLSEVANTLLEAEKEIKKLEA